jgi:hypothetical protein
VNNHDGQEKGGDDVQEDGSPRNQGAGFLRGKGDSERGEEALEKPPEQERSFLTGPYRGNFEIEGERSGGVLGHITKGKIVTQERREQQQEGGAEERWHPIGRVLGTLYPAAVLVRKSPYDSEHSIKSRNEGQAGE